MRSWFFGWLLVTKIRWLGCFFSKFRVSLFRADVAFSVTTIWFSNVIPFNLIISFYICFITNTNANLLHLLVFSFTGMFFFLFFFLRYLVDLRPHISQGSDARSEISHVYAFKLVFVLFTRFFFSATVFTLLFHFFLVMLPLFIFLLLLMALMLFPNRSLCFKKCFNYFILPLLAHFTKKLTCFWRISFDFFQQFKH